MNSGAGRDNPLLNGPSEGRVHSSGRPRCGTSLLHLLQPLNVQRGVHTCWSYGGRLPSLPGFIFISAFQLFIRLSKGGKAVRSCASYWCVRRPYWNLSFPSEQSAVHTTASKQSLLASPIHKVRVITKQNEKNLLGDPIQPRDCMEKKLKRNIYLTKK